MKKILVIDDNEDILTMLKTFLVINGYAVMVSLSCGEGLDIFYSFQPDLVLLDINVGSSDGRDVCRNIKAQAEYQHIPVILISANSDGLESYADCGANAAIEKPFNFYHLRTLLDTSMQ